MITRYNRIKADPRGRLGAAVVIFAGKAASAYHTAKQIIHLINDASQSHQQRSADRRQVKVVFIPNYSVSLAQTIIPAADLSERISLAGDRSLRDQ